MERELLGLAMFLLAAVAGAARFRSQKFWDEVSLCISTGANYAGTLLLVASLLWDQEPALLVPLSLLILMHGTAFFYQNHFSQILGLPLVIGEVLLEQLFPEIRVALAQPMVLLLAFIVHMSFMAASLRLLLKLPRVLPRYGASWSPYALAMKLSGHLAQLTPSEPSTHLKA